MLCNILVLTLSLSRVQFKAQVHRAETWEVSIPLAQSCFDHILAECMT
eukprot:bmy_00855T0